MKAIGMEEFNTPQVMFKPLPILVFMEALSF
jgi:hypothetical protein